MKLSEVNSENPETKMCQEITNSYFMQTLRNSDSDSQQPAVAPVPRTENWMKARVVDAFLDPNSTTQQVS